MKAATLASLFASKNSRFQSTPPVKAATCSLLRRPGQVVISIHAAREGGDFGWVVKKIKLGISIHAAREGGDVIVIHRPKPIPISIHAAREGGDGGWSYKRQAFFISIHAAREGGDIQRHLSG